MRYLNILINQFDDQFCEEIYLQKLKDSKDSIIQSIFSTKLNPQKYTYSITKYKYKYNGNYK